MLFARIFQSHEKMLTRGFVSLPAFQLELQKSREAAADLQVLQTAMNEVQETLGGGMVGLW